MSEHQAVLDALKTASVLRYQDFLREFLLQDDASLMGLGAVLSQEDDLLKPR